MLQINLTILAMIGVSLIFAMLMQISHLTFAQGLPFAYVTDAWKYYNGYSDVLMKSKSNFQSLSGHGCDNTTRQPASTIQYQKGYSEYAKSPCGSAAYVLSSLDSSSPVPSLISSVASSSELPMIAKMITDHQPVIADPNLKIETVFKGDKFPSSFAFLGPNDILLLQKNNGTVDRIVNGTLYAKSLLHANVSTEQERGMLGIAVTRMKNSTNNTQPVTTYVFLYLTEANSTKASDNVTGIKPKCNCIYRYELLNNSLVNLKLLLSLPATPGPQHNGGRMLVD